MKPFNLFPYDSNIDFMRMRWVSLSIAFLLMVVALGAMGTRSFNFALDFTGGIGVELRYDKAPDVDQVREQLASAGFHGAQVQNFGSARDLLIRLPNREDLETSRVSETVMNTLQQVGGAAPELRRVEFVGPQVGKELATDGAMALLLVILGIVVYLAMRFEWRFAVSAIIANLHDIVIILGFFAFFQWEFSLPVLAAVLAVLGYSVNESVVVFDRVRETFKKKRHMTTPQVLDHAITQTISRTVITHGSTQVMVLSMLIFGGETLYYFALALTIGICFGIYSSVLVASPLVMWLGVSREHFIKVKKQIEGANADGAVV